MVGWQADGPTLVHTDKGPANGTSESAPWIVWTHRSSMRSDGGYEGQLKEVFPYPNNMAFTMVRTSIMLHLPNSMLNNTFKQVNHLNMKESFTQVLTTICISLTLCPSEFVSDKTCT